MSSPQPFKNYYNRELLETLAERIRSVHQLFPSSAFVAHVEPQLPPLELKNRVAVIAEGLRLYLPPDFPDAVNILLATLGPPHTEAEGMFTDGWRLAPLAAFVEYYGLEHVDESLAAMHAITQRHTAEFAIRPFLVRDPERVLAVLREWVRDESFHVRRLASEGTRTRLPWATRLPQFIADPAPVLELLDVLKDDPTRYVRTSVANNLNDIAKDHPDLVLETLARWNKNASDERRWVIGRALRTLIKQGHPEALRLLDAQTPQVQLVLLEVMPQALQVGETLTITAVIKSMADTPQRVIIDYAIHFAGARGELRPKVFKLKTQILGPGETLNLIKRHSFRPVSIRRYYPGPHRASIQINGVVLGSADFALE